jgi:hypothetical protein
MFAAGMSFKLIPALSDFAIIKKCVPARIREDEVAA